MIASLARRHQTPSTFSKTLTATAFPLLADPPPPPSDASPSSDLHRNLCLSLVDRLILRGNVPAARGLIDRIITRPGWSASDAVSAADHADSRGLSLDYPRLLHGLVRSGQSSKAEEFYAGVRSRASVSSDPCVLDSMILCYSALGSPDHARLHFQHLIRMGHSPSKPAYDALMRAFFAEDRHSEAADLFFESGLLPLPSSFTCLIDGLSHTGKPDEAFRVLDEMLRSGVRPIKRNFRSLAFALCKRGRIEEAEDLCRLMLGHGFYVDRVMCTSLVHGYCKAGKLDLALNVFCWMKHPDAYAYDTLLFGFVKQGYIEDAWRLLDRMVEKGLSPDAVTYHVMISWFCKNLRIDCALELLRMMDRVGVPPDVRIYTVLISALCKAGRTEEANCLFDRMLDAGLIPDHLMFVLMISKYPKGHEPVLVLKILQAIVKRVSGVDVAMSSELSDCSCDEEVLQEKIAPLLDEILKRDVPPDVVLDVLIKACCAEGKTRLAFVFMDKMVSHGCQPSVSTYNCVLSCLFKENLTGQAESLMALMKEMGVAPNFATYWIKIDADLDSGNIDAALVDFDRMVEEGLRPSIAIYDSIVCALCERNRIEEAERMFKMMCEGWEMPDEAVYTTLLIGYCKVGEILNALDLFDEMLEKGIKPSCRTYCALINGLLENNLIDEGCRYLGQMLDDGFTPNTVLYSMLAHQFCQKGEVNFGIDFINQMVRNQIEPDIITYGLLIDGICKSILYEDRRHPSLVRKLREARDLLPRMLPQKPVMPGELNKRVFCRSAEGKIGIALYLMEDLVESGLVPDSRIYNAMIMGFCRAGMIGRAYGLLDEIPQTSMIPDHMTYTILIRAHGKLGDINSAVALFNQMNEIGCNAEMDQYNAVIESLCVAGRAMEALSVFFMMQKKGMVPNEASYNNLVVCLYLHYSTDLALRMSEEMLLLEYPLRHYVYNRLLTILCKENKLAEAYGIFNAMLKRGRIPDERTKKLLVEECLRQGETGLASLTRQNTCVDGVDFHFDTP